MKKLIIASAVLISLTGAASYGLTRPGVIAEDNTPVRVDQLEDKVENHEARITNTENDVADLQESTSTPPSPNRTEVPSQTQSVTQPEAPAPQPSPVTVVSFEVQPIPGTENENCKHTYSDGTARTFLWRTVTYNQIRIVQTSGKCDPTVIGSAKP